MFRTLLTNYYFDIYGDVFYTITRNVLQTANADDFYFKRL